MGPRPRCPGRARGKKPRSVPAIGTPVVSGCGITSTSCSIVIPTAEPLAPGDYTFTLKAGATIEDVLGNVYTQAADRVVNFTVVDAPSTPVQCL